mmetsp:Transcript_33410/g.79211  ORF Transcript_33410/g.79211 Transcript_33410/m.79211 type:complete len:479 (-) Transcript_33410:315-1751(-)
MSQLAPAVPLTKHYTDRPNFPSDLEIVVVDSGSTSSDTLLSSLRDCKYSVTVCRTSAEAVSVLSKNPTDLIIAEMKLVTSYGSTSNQLKVFSSVIPMVLCCENGDPEDVWNCISCGAVDILPGPLQASKVQNLWQHVVRKQGLKAVPSGPAPSQHCAAPPLAAPKSSADSSRACSGGEEKGRKRKSREQSSTTAAVAARPSSAMRVSSHAQPLLMNSNQAVARQAPGLHPSYAPVMGYWPPPMMGAPALVPGGYQLSWGTPLVSMPAGMSFVPGNRVGSAWPHMAQVQAPHGVVHHHPQPPMVAQSGPHEGAMHQPPHSGVLAAHHVVQQPCPVPSAPQALPVDSSQAPSEKTPQENDGKALEPGSPNAWSESSTCVSAESDNSGFGFLSEQDLVTIPDPPNLSSVATSVPEVSNSCDLAVDCPQLFDDIGDDEFDFVDFAMSDAFPSTDENEVLPSIGVSIKKSDSLLNLLNIQMVC